jgi:hypothetical protein
LAEEERAEEALVIHLKLSDTEFGSFEERERAFSIEDRLESALRNAAQGEYDGHEFGDGWCRFYLYGEDANALAEAVLPVLTSFATLPGSFVLKRFGPPGSNEERISLP